MKRAIAFLGALLLLLGLPLLAFGEGDGSLLVNGGFETLNASGEPEGWYASTYHSQEGYSKLAVTSEKAHSGLYSAVIENASANDARYICTVTVKPETLYRLSGYVLVEHMEDVGNGANFGIEDIYSFSDGLFDTDGEWTYLEWYGETGEDQTELTFGVRVGGYSAESIGKAYFDDLVLEEVDALPQNVIASLWYRENVSVSQTSSDDAEKNTALFILLAAAFVLAAALAAPVLEKKLRMERLWLRVLMLSALLLRLFLAVSVYGYEVDIGCFTAWSLRMADVGPAGFYTADYFCDYPPGALLLLWPIGLLLRAGGIGSESLTLLLVKLLPILCDLAGGLVLYGAARKKLPTGAAAALAALYWFNPAALVNGAAWGQMDSVLALLILFTVLLVMNENWKVAIPLFVASALVKPQALLLAPIGAAWFLFAVIRSSQKKRAALLRQAVFGIGFAVLTALAIALPFSLHQEWDWLIRLYTETLGSYAYATLNTANLYYLFGLNWTALSETASSALLIVCALGFAACTAGLRLRRMRKFEGLVPLFAVMAVLMVVMLAFGVNYAVFGYSMMSFAYLCAALLMRRDRQEGALPFYLALALIGVYMLGVKVHERYLFPALLLLILSYVFTRDRRTLLLCVGLSVTTFVNTAIVLENSILLGAAQGHLNSDTLTLNRILCLMNLALLGYAGWIGLTGLRTEKPVALHAEPRMGETPPSYEKMLLHPADPKLHLSKRDWLVMLMTTAAYAVLAFSHLGSTAAPQTAWVSSSSEEQVVLELEENTRFSVLYYGGVSYQNFSISVSDDGENWSESYPCEMREGLCYRWLYAVEAAQNGSAYAFSSQNSANVLWLEGKYLRINAESAGLNLWEVVARDENGQNLPLKLVSHTGARADMLDEEKPASNLIDETDTCIGEPSWYNSTYFDEIYHARTAYEHLHGQAPYETTHPPLGKLMMAAGIALFGMTPFGWRFAGALVGVLMLPALYLLAMQLTHRRSVATVSMLAFALDLMHFTQTRIATIDSFPVLFILLSILFMVRYMQTDVFIAEDRERLCSRAYLRTLLPLLLSGICMGISIACKWIGLYSAVGLAALFFLTIYRQYRASLAAYDLELSGRKFTYAESLRVSCAQRFTLHRIFLTCGFCVLFFVLIPALIYCLSYIPYLAPTGPVTLRRIIAAQEGMLNYHSTPGLGMDHPFQSPWWQWPFILKPMWFAQDTFEPAGYASTIMCMGNPWVFYIGAVAMAAVICLWIAKYVRIRQNRLVLVHGDGNLTLTVLVIGFAAQYLPWVLVPRSMYIYHYFASVPFIILATAWLLDHLPESRPQLRRGVMAFYLAGALVFFMMFFPYASGVLTSTDWLDAMKWFSHLYY